jgi:hypothetical protein
MIIRVIVGAVGAKDTKTVVIVIIKQKIVASMTKFTKPITMVLIME